uniref:Reverse transcriptase zinc-binding domain-containing protein n=1 Tax=Fagus sylvatica TaxID=28930 RepID=A0A2N9GLQ5_FAGSY
MNTILGLMNIVNEWYTDEKQVEDIAVAYFEDLFHTTQPVDMRDTLLAVKNTVTQEVNRTLLKSFTAEEVRLALFQMHPSKAPGPNDFWGSHEVHNIDKYLGLPAMIGRSKKSIFNGLKERIVQRLQGWKEKFLSKAGREVLIKAVAQSIPTYAMNCFRLPKTWFDEISGLIASYWWGQKKDERKMHWLKWDKLCAPKSDGGLGFQNLHLFNTALLAKQSWRLLTNPHSLFFRIFKARYFPQCSFLKVQMGSNPSFLWRSIMSGRDTINNGIRWSNQDGRLRWPLWNGTKTGVFAVHSAYEMLESDRRKSNTGESSTTAKMRWLWRKMWKMAIPGKVKHFMRRAYHETLPTYQQLHR